MGRQYKLTKEAVELGRNQRGKMGRQPMGNAKAKKAILDA